MNLPLYYLDLYNRDKTTISKEEFDIKLTKVMRNSDYIIDGNYNDLFWIKEKLDD